MDGPANYAFLHGGGQGDWVWNDLVAALRVQADGDAPNILLLNAPGCGAKRGRMTDDLSIEDVARELVEDIERAGLKDVVLVGHSQAGQAMVFMVEMRPDLFKRLIYISCSGPLPGQNVLQMVGSGLHGSNDSEVGWPLDPRTTDVNERYAAIFCNDMEANQAEPFLGKLGRDGWPTKTYTATSWRYDHLGAVPASYVICLRDGILPVAWQEKFADRYKVERRIMIDAGHQVMISRPHGLAEILRHEAA